MLFDVLLVGRADTSVSPPGPLLQRFTGLDSHQLCLVYPPFYVLLTKKTVGKKNTTTRSPQ